MHDPESGPEVDAWEIFALAACQELRGRAGVHVAPRLPAEAVVRALQGYLRPRPDELLLAIVEQPGAQGPEPGLALTTRRLCWPTGAGGEAVGARSGGAMAFETLPDRVEVAGGPAPRLDLGGGRGPAFPGRDRADLEAIGGVLGTIGRARRSGDLAGSTTRAALDRSRAEIGQVVRQAEALHRIGGEARSFGADVQAATPRVVVTPALVAACLVVFAAMVLSGVSAIAPSVPDLIAWGGNLGDRLAVDGQAWRLLTSMFLHGGLIHLGINLYVLWRVGPLVERLFGNAGFALLYLAAGLGGAMVSAWWHPLVVSVGASGAIFGLIGGLGAFLVTHRSAIPATVVARVRGGVVAFVVYNTLFGLAIPGIDNAAHLGGLATGFVAGLLLRRPWPVDRPTAGLARQLGGGVALAAGLSLLGVAATGQIARDPEVVARPGGAGPGPVGAYNAMMGELAPLLRRYEAIDRDLDALLGRLARVPVPEARDDLGALIDRSEANRAAIARVDPADPDLRPLLDAIAGAESDRIRAMRSLGRHLDEPGDKAAIEGPGGFLPLRRRGEEQVARFDALRQAYFDAHGLTAVPLGPGPGDADAGE